MEKLRVGVIGCGRIGTRRMEEVVSHPRSELVVVVDTDKKAAADRASQFRVRSETDWSKTVLDAAIDALIVSTPNGYLRDIGCAALKNGKHVLMEKPMGRNLTEAQDLQRHAETHKKILKIGFNHRYHPALSKAFELHRQGVIGELINIRARYGHGGRPGYEKEWRGNPELAGGGELTDQGVHIADLIQWFAGLPQEAFGYLQTAIWPIQPLEDNGFALFRYSSGLVASFHTSWTQWKNLFSFEIYGSKGSLTIEGLGRSYGTERLVTALRQPEGGVPLTEETVYDGPDLSWKREWDDFVGAVADGKTYGGTPAEGVSAMKMINAVYASHKNNAPATIV